MRVITFLSLVLVLSVLPLARQADAYETFAYEDGDETLHLKWGSNRAGTSGGVVRWSLMPAGTPGSAVYCGNSCPGVSTDTIQVEIAPGQGFAPMSLAQLEPRVAAALQRWSLATGIRFVRVDDSGVAVNDAGALPPSTGHIRIGVFAFAAGGGAVAYAPPPNGGSAAGDVLFDANSWYQFAPGAEGDAFSQTHAPNDFDSLLLHELGHAIGLAHPPFDGSCPAMQVDPACLGRINRELDADDLAGAAFLYGRDFGDGFESDPRLRARVRAALRLHLRSRPRTHTASPRTHPDRSRPAAGA